MKLRIHRLAVAEIDHEVDYYESRQEGLGAELEDEPDAVFSMIVQFPEPAPQWKQRADRRVAVLDRFRSPCRIKSSVTRSLSSRSRTRVGDPATGRAVDTRHQGLESFARTYTASDAGEGPRYAVVYSSAGAS